MGGRAFLLVVACSAASGHRELPGGEGRGGKAYRGLALVLFLLNEGLVAESQAGEREGGMGFTREKSEGTTLWWAALHAEGRWGET